MRPEIPFSESLFACPDLDQYDRAPSRNTVPKMHCAGEKDLLGD
jgi:hypothetical protein